MGQRAFVAGVGGRKNFQMSKTFPRLHQGVEAFKTARAVGCEMETGNFTRVNVMPQ